MAMPSFPGRVHFVSHVVRDIYARLPEILDPHFARKNGGEFYKQFVADVDKHWPSKLETADDPSGEAADRVAISTIAYNAVSKLLARHQAHQKQPKSALALATALACVAVAGAAQAGDVYRDVVNSSNLQQQSIDGTGVTVAIIDSGVADVPELSGVVVHEENFTASPSGDQFGHGTFVAGLVHRTAPGAKIVSVKLSGPDGSVDVSQVLAAIQWVVANKDTYGIDVLNISFGNDSTQPYKSSPLDYAVERAWDAGITVVAAAGNAGDAAGTITKPGDDPLVITVGASDDHMTSQLNDDSVPTFTGRGPTQDNIAKPDVVAPGTHVVSLRAPGSTIDVNHPEGLVSDTEFRGSGTSFSTPIVAGTAAQLLQAHPTDAPNDIKYRLRHSAIGIDAPGTAQGKGVTDALAASNTNLGSSVNNGVQRGNGKGSMDADRGSMKVKVKVDDTGLVSGLLGTVTTLLDGNTTAQGKPFNDDEFTASQWGASQWGASQWGASQWGASQWGASQWGASQWGASQWWASQWG